MGNLENKNKKKRRKENLQKMILASVAAAGVLSIALLAPNVLQAMNKLGIFPNPRRKKYIPFDEGLERYRVCSSLGEHLELEVQYSTRLPLRQRRESFSANFLSCAFSYFYFPDFPYVTLLHS